MDINEIRSHFPNLDYKINDKKIVYLDNGATAFKPNEVISKVIDHYSHGTSNIHRGAHRLADQGTELYEETREAVSKLLGAESKDQIIFTKGTTESINLIAYGYALNFLNEGDQILVSKMEHHSNIVPWQLIETLKNIKVIPIEVTKEGLLDLNDYKEKLNSKVKIVACTHVSNALGTINPIKEIIKMAHQAGAVVCVDGAQAIPHMKVDVQDLDADFYSFSAHKIFGPTGVGVLYGKADLLNKMSPFNGGGSMIDKVSFDGTTFHEIPYKFEAGTPNIAGVIAFKGALDFVNSIGIENIDKYEHELLIYGTEKLQELEFIELYGPQNLNQKCAILSFNVKGAHPSDVGTLLDKMGLAVRCGHHCCQPLMEVLGVTGTVRASFTIYNTKEEIDSLVDSLKKLLDFL